MCPVDSKLRECTLKTPSDGATITYGLLASYRYITPKAVALSTAWYNKFGYFIDAQNNRQTLGCDMSWSLLHFKQHVQVGLHTDVELILQRYSPIQQGGSLYFFILMRQLVFSNEQSYKALVSLVQAYTIATDWEDGLIHQATLLCNQIYYRHTS